MLDVDLCGPSVPYLLGLENKNVFQSSEGWVPVYVKEDEKLAVMSIAFLLNSRNDSVVWRGPKKTSELISASTNWEFLFLKFSKSINFFLGMIKQFLSDVHWQDLDYLIIDTPPGTSDEHITVMENLRYLSEEELN